MGEEGKGRGREVGKWGSRREGKRGKGRGGREEGEGREEGRKHGRRTLCQVLPHEHPTSETDTH